MIDTLSYFNNITINYSFLTIFGDIPIRLEAFIFDFKQGSLVVILLLFSSLTIRFLLEMFGQKWIKTTAHTVTLSILPIITYIITIVIAGNIALSLGMVGALSIVRFRNPVRSPLELSVYFASITMGITAAVSINKLFLFLYSILLVSFLIFLFSYFYKIFFKKNFFTTSFSEGNALSTLEVQCKKNIQIIDNSSFLKTKSAENNKINYLLVSEDFKSLKYILSMIENNDELIHYQLSEE